MSDEHAQLCEAALKAVLVDDGSDTIALASEEWETGEVATLKWRLYHTDDEPDEVDEPADYPAIELAMNTPRRVHPHDPYFLEATGNLIAITHYGRDRKRQVLSEIEGIVVARLYDRGRWTIIDEALPDNLGLGGLVLSPTDVELNGNLQGQAWNLTLHLIDTTADTTVSATTTV